jgi:cytochrome c peroxidase
VASTAGAVPTKLRVRIPFSSLASQSVGPPGNPFEMSFAGRNFADIGKKLLNPNLVPLGKQNVHPTDSVLGALSNSTIGRRGTTLKPGLKTSYAAMVKAAFHDKYWNGGAPSAANSQMESNFALFFGLAVQLYEATLVSDDSPYDRFMGGDPSAMSASAQEGLNIFLSDNDPGGVGGNCINCHGTSTFSNASVMHLGATNFGSSLPEALVERMIMGDGGGSWYDSGYYDVALRPIPEDAGRGGDTPFKMADGTTPIPLSFIQRAMMKANGAQFPAYMDTSLIPTLPCGPGFQLVCPSDTRVATQGTFKVPTLRNVELTGPYFHSGGYSTLMQVMDFYGRGGNFAAANISTFDPDVNVLCGLNPSPDPAFCPQVGPDQAAIAEANQSKVVDFLLALTDERVRWEMAPFDHPALAIPNGATIKKSSATDNMLNIPAVGAGGRAAQLLPPVATFLRLDPHSP